jgi:hypothetical protein
VFALYVGAPPELVEPLRARPLPASIVAGGVGTLLLGLLFEASEEFVDDDFQGLSDESEGGDQPQPPVLWQPVVANGSASSNVAVASFFAIASERSMMYALSLSELSLRFLRRVSPPRATMER